MFKQNRQKRDKKERESMRYKKKTKKEIVSTSSILNLSRFILWFVGRGVYVLPFCDIQGGLCESFGIKSECVSDHLWGCDNKNAK